MSVMGRVRYAESTTNKRKGIMMPRYIVGIQRVSYMLVEADDYDKAKERAIAVAKHGNEEAKVQVVSVEPASELFEGEQES